MKSNFSPLGASIDFYQKKKGISSYKLAQLITPDASAISKHKKGANITLATLEEYAAALDVNLSDLFLKSEQINKGN